MTARTKAARSGAESHRTTDDDEELMMQEFNNLKVKDELHDISQRLKVKLVSLII
jgi:hypothetical protein